MPLDARADRMLDQSGAAPRPSRRIDEPWLRCVVRDPMFQPSL